MTSRDFCYWLQGYFEINSCQPKCKQTVERDGRALTNDQVNVIQKHLALVFKHEIDPSFGGPDKQEALDQIHKPPADWTNPSKPIARC